jgi:predicted ATPase/class 3 adenylate cyclase
MSLADDEHMRELPSGTVTFLFTDIEGSTRLIEELGEEGYVEALAEHRRLLREAFSRHGGVEVDTQGDAFLYAFPDPAEALAAAADGQDALTSGSVKVRIGVHTGEPLLSGEGYAGRELHRAARIAACGHGGQVVVSQATRALVDGELTELGEHRLKDFDEPIALYQLGSQRFPPLKTISNTNLPRPASSFVGRERELEQVTARLRGRVRLLTLSGPGGSGKTRLAIEAASELVPDFGAGVFWVGLAPLRDPILVSETIAQTLGAKDGLVAHIGERELLLLLDNLEQVVEAAPQFGSLLEACPNLKLLVTSRELLRIRGEVEYAVPPLVELEAVELFCKRAQVKPEETIAELCRRLDNLPLAIELAAARTSVLSPAQILERLSERLDLLKGGRDAEARQQTLRATIEWSHDLLSDDEQTLFARLAVFRGGCTLEAAEAVAEADLDTLQSLVDKSLVRHTDERFSMLEMIREYAQERLVGGGETAELRRRHAMYVLRLAEDADGEPIAEILSRISPEYENLRSALEWAREQGEDEILLRLVAAVGEYWDFQGLVREARSWVGLALERGASPRRARMQVLQRAIGQAVDAHAFGRARTLLAEYSGAAEQGGDERELLTAKNLSAAVAAASGDFEGARVGFDGLGRLAREVGDRQMEAVATVNLGWAEMNLGDFRTGLQHSTEAAEQFRELGSEWGYSVALADCGRNSLGLEEWTLAEDWFRQALAILNRLGAKPRIAIAAEGLAAALVAKREEERGAQLLGAAAALRDELDVRFDDFDEQIHERAVAAAKAALGDEAFAAAWVRGQAMTAESVVAFCTTAGQDVAADARSTE